MVASEARPFCKTGGLADVVYSLSKELAVLGEDVSIILPFYDSVRRQLVNEPLKKAASFNTHMSWRKQTVDVYQVKRDGINYFLIENRQYFERGHIYGDFDDGERFAFFAMAVKEFLLTKSLYPNIIHVHDWQAGMLPCLLKTDAICHKKFAKTKFVFTIHNPAFQGMMPKFTLGDFYNLSDDLFDNGSVRFNDQVSTLKAGIVYSDKITTVSPTHHLELLTPEGGMGLDTILRYREWDFCGILNGIDYLEFNPNSDQQIAMPYTEDKLVSAKKANRETLMRQFNLKNNSKGPLFSLVTRITWQKGFDIIFPAIEDLVNRGASIFMLGSGESQYEQRWEELRRKYPDRIGLYIGYSDALAHKVYAASDFFIMPSLFEPCGIGQIIAQRYGTLPIVRETGGLKDTVVGYNPVTDNKKKATGFSFVDYDINGLRYSVNVALGTYYDDEETFRTIIHNAINLDRGWEASAKKYQEVYRKACTK